MADEKQGAIESGQEVITPAANEDQLADKDLEKAAGGTWTWTEGGKPPTD